MKQRLSSLTRWVIAGMLAGLETAAIAGFLDVNGRFSTIDVPGADFTSPNDINNAGQIVGSFAGPGGGSGLHGFLDVGGTFSRIDVPGAYITFAQGINNAGQIVGLFDEGDGRPHGFLYVGGTFSRIDVPGAYSTRAYGHQRRRANRWNLR